MDKLTHLEKQKKAHKWWKANKEIIRIRIVKNYDLPDTYKL
tara:strand:+ start:152 stop:274 length:123 start_codon:yes stop_codon:yes gene_type:complete